MAVLVTGGLGSVGISTVHALSTRGHHVRVLERPTRRTQTLARRMARRHGDQVSFVWADIRDGHAVKGAMTDCERVVHLAALIPPAADRDPETAWAVNVGGTEAVVSAAASMDPPPPVIFASSVAVYGDRVARPMIRTDDPLAPSPGDVYSRSKIAAEERIRASGVPWSILRLSFVLDVDGMRMDPLMFSMPLDTSIEVVAVEDVGTAFASAAECADALGACLHIAGGLACRTTYREFLSHTLRSYGLGRHGLPESAFSTGEFHCGFMDTAVSEQLLDYQHTTLDELYARIRRRRRLVRVLLSPVRSIARAYLLRRSPYYRPHTRDVGVRGTSRLGPGRA